MKQIANFISEKLRISKDTKIQEINYEPKDNKELCELVKKLIEERGEKADLNDIDTSNITDMSKVFYMSHFDGDISRWDVSNVTNMQEMFKYANFRQIKCRRPAFFFFPL